MKKAVLDYNQNICLLLSSNFASQPTIKEDVMRSKIFSYAKLVLVVVVATLASGEIYNAIALCMDENYYHAGIHGTTALLMPIALVFIDYCSTALFVTSTSVFIWWLVAAGVKGGLAVTALALHLRDLPGDRNLAEKVLATPLYLGWGSSFSWYVMMAVVLCVIFGITIWQEEK